MKVSFKNQNQIGSLNIENGIILSLDVVCEREKSILRDLFSTKKQPSLSSVSRMLKKFGYSEIEVVNKKATTINQALLDANFYGSLTLMGKHEPILCKGYGYRNIENHLSNTSSTRFSCGVISEVIAAATVHILAEKNFFSLDDRLDRFFPANCLRYPDLSSITIHMLLHHTSGLPPLIKRSFPVLDYIPTQLQIDQIFRKPLLYNPGEYSSHSDANFRILGAILEQVTEKSYGDIVQEIDLLGEIPQTHPAIEYEKNGTIKKKDHLSQRTCIDDMEITTKSMYKLFDKIKPYLQKTETVKEFGKCEIVTTACGMHCDFLFGHRVYYRKCMQSLIYCIPKKEFQISLLANKQPSDDFSMRKFISLVTTNHL